MGLEADVGKIIAGTILIIVLAVIVLNSKNFSEIVTSVGSNVVNFTNAATGSNRKAA